MNDRGAGPFYGWCLGTALLLIIGGASDKLIYYGLPITVGILVAVALLAVSSLGLSQTAVRLAGVFTTASIVLPIYWRNEQGYPNVFQSPVVFGAICFFWLIGPLMLATGSMKKTMTYWLLIALALFLVAPFVWMILVSLHPNKAPIPPLSEIIPDKPAWDNYRFVLNHPTLPVSRFFFNSLVVTVTVVLSQLFLTSLAAYGFARIRFKGREPIFALFLGSMMFAGPVTQIPVFLFLRNLGWLDTYAALIVPGISSAFSVFLLRQFFLQIPAELDEAARIDGAGDFRIYWRVIMPLSKAALATCAAFSFFGAWTEFFNPLIFTNSTEMRTLEVGLSIFKNSYGGTNWPLQMTAAVIVMTPLLLVFLFTQRYFTKGITLGSIK